MSLCFTVKVVFTVIKNKVRSLFITYYKNFVSSAILSQWSAVSLITFLL